MASDGRDGPYGAGSEDARGSAADRWKHGDAAQAGDAAQTGEAASAGDDTTQTGEAADENGMTERRGGSGGGGGGGGNSGSSSSSSSLGRSLDLFQALPGPQTQQTIPPARSGEAMPVRVSEVMPARLSEAMPARFSEADYRGESVGRGPGLGRGMGYGAHNSSSLNVSLNEEGLDEFEEAILDAPGKRREYLSGAGGQSRRRAGGGGGDGGMRGVWNRVTGGRVGTSSTSDGMDFPLTTAPPSKFGAATVSGQHGSSDRHVKHSFRFGYGREPADATPGTRDIGINDRFANHQHKFCSNYVSTTKYNVATFVPKFLFEQFSKYANLFFLFTAIIQQVPNVSPTNRWTTVGPLIIVLSVSAVKECVEDFKRRCSDRELNRSLTEVYVNTRFEHRKWLQVKVGDIVRISSGESFPADLILLASSEPEGLCYIETANLDGETNLKIKQALPETSELLNPTELNRLHGQLRSEQPNNSLYTYEGTLQIDLGGGERSVPLTPDQLLLRGAQLRNTPWIYGIVIFTGHETKLMRNASATPIKRTAVEKMINKQIIFLFTILIVLSITSSTGQVIVNAVRGKSAAYLGLGNSNVVGGFFLNFLTFWILYSNLVPISLFVTVELVKYAQAFLISNDLDMYHAESDTPTICRTSNLVEELGQVEYIFSDKTGTLTCNQMKFKQVSIAGIPYAETVSEDQVLQFGPKDEQNDGLYDFTQLAENLRSSQAGWAIHEFLTMLAICHTVIPEKQDEKNKIKYQAASPDEGALVEGAASLGYVFTTRKPRSVGIEIYGHYTEYELLNICEFNSTRKRMSAIFRCPDGRIRLYCKGADTVIIERLRDDNPYVDSTLQHLEDYATEGLRTLCLAYREVPESEYYQWLSIYENAALTINDRQAELDKAAELIETNLFLLGATAIEDRLQDGVPDTIYTLKAAGIKIWILTGDRQETAINIALSCKLISEDMSLIIVNENDRIATKRFMQDKLVAIRSQLSRGVEVEALALIIDGKSLEYALEKELEKSFLDLAVICKAVVCCRVSPLQKALVVKLVKKNLNAILLAVGDGANDVGMIQAAHVGVGISGLEGLQAARSADVSIGQFRFLRKLLLVHGSWSYQRLSKLILYSFYKNVTLYLTQFWYVFQNGFSGQVIYESWSISLYNVFFTVAPPIVIGVFDQFISARLLDRYPQLYQLGQKGVFFNVRSFWGWIANGVYHSILLYYVSISIWPYDGIKSNGIVSGHWVWGSTLYTAVLATVLGKAALVTNLWTYFTWFAIPGSFIFWLVFLVIYSWVAPSLGFSQEYLGIVPELYGNIMFYITWLYLPFLCLLRDFAWKYAKRMYFPQSYHHIQEIQKYNIADYRPRMEQFQKAIRKVRQVMRTRKQRGYAFSQGDDSQARVIRAYDTTQSRGRYGEMRNAAKGDQSQTRRSMKSMQLR